MTAAWIPHLKRAQIITLQKKSLQSVGGAECRSSIFATWTSMTPRRILISITNSHSCFGSCSWATRSRNWRRAFSATSSCNMRTLSRKQCQSRMSGDNAEGNTRREYTRANVNRRQGATFFAESWFQNGTPVLQLTHYGVATFLSFVVLQMPDAE